MTVCQSCQAEVPQGARFCPSCGFEFATAPTMTAWPMPHPPSRRSAASSATVPRVPTPGPVQDDSPPADRPAPDPPPPAPDLPPVPPEELGAPPSVLVPGPNVAPPPIPGPSIRQPGIRSARSIGAGRFGGSPAAVGGQVSASSILSESSIDGSRFAPGIILADRYRIVKQLGKGGMGEVYLADDLKLVQPVALKFLPPHLAYNRVSLDRFFNEVRIARAVSHPNVCRVHDISEVEDQHFISMEYVDGEDLASVLRRFGKLPPEKGLQVARQLCAGLAAAHDKGVLHRDLKPANVMIDGKGSVRITDFGLAGLAAELRGQQGRAGTPAYMAPEQFAGQGVSVRSDIYALGLVLYEIFTGKPVYRPETIEQLSRMHSEVPPRLSAVVPDIDPGIERVILRCLERDPSLRPKSAMAVSASLPGGDPLAEALAAGETPSPELVAASGSRGVLRPGVAMALLLSVAVCLVVVAAIDQRTKLFAHVPMERSGETLTAKALEVLDQLGAGREHSDSAHGFVENRAVLDMLKKMAAGKSGVQDADDPERLRKGQPAAMLFWYRESPTPMAPRTIVQGVEIDDPPMAEPGMYRVVLDTDGRLIEYLAVPGGAGARSPDGDGARVSPEPAPAPPPPIVDWAAVFKLARLEPRKFVRSEALPTEVPPIYCDQRIAWDGHAPDRPEIPLHIDAGALDGVPVYFRLRPGDLGLPQRQPGEYGAGNIVLGVALLTVLYATPLGIAVYNIKRGRGDRRGAMRLAMVMFIAVSIQKLLGMHYGLSVADAAERYIRALGDALYITALAWVCYIAIEPIIRRQRPETIISWTRLLGGDWKDPLVGRDLLIGCVIGSAWPLLLGVFSLASPWCGFDRPLPQSINTETLTGTRQAAAVLVGLGLDSLLYPLLIALLDLVARWIGSGWGAGWGSGWGGGGAGSEGSPLIHRTIHYTLMSVLFLVLIMNQVGNDFNLLFIVLAVIAGCGCGYIAQCFGLLMLVSAFFSAGILMSFPIALGLPGWITTTCLSAMVVIIGLAAFGFVTSLAGRKILSADLFERQ